MPSDSGSGSGIDSIGRIGSNNCGAARSLLRAGRPHAERSGREARRGAVGCGAARHGMPAAGPAARGRSAFSASSLSHGFGSVAEAELYWEFSGASEYGPLADRLE